MAVVAGADGPLDIEHRGDLVAVIALVALSAVVEVVGHERVVYPHTLRGLEGSSTGSLDHAPVRR